MEAQIDFDSDFAWGKTVESVQEWSYLMKYSFPYQPNNYKVPVSVSPDIEILYMCFSKIRRLLHVSVSIFHVWNVELSLYKIWCYWTLKL